MTRPLPTHCELIVIGAGAAGLAAAARARALGLDTLLLEAGSRIGGRCVTDRDSLGLPWDRGAHWMHQARSNPFVGFARDFAMDWEDGATITRRWLVQAGRWATPEENAEIEHYLQSCFDALDQAGQEEGDRAAAEVLPPHPRWRPLLEGWLQALNGGEVEALSTQDNARYEEDGCNWPLREGYGALLAALHPGHGALLDTPVERIAWSGAEVEVTTARGRVRAGRVIVTLPTPVLAREELFDPPLPPEKRAAIEALPLGRHEKLALRFAPDALPPDPHWYFHRVDEQRAACNALIRPFGRPLAILHLGGSLFRRWGVSRAAEALEPALDMLEAAFGRPLRSSLLAWDATDWRHDPRFGGSYSSALPGRADARAALTAPLGERLFFAGEACSIPSFGTVHGAHASGIAAAEAVAAAFRRAAFPA